MATTEPVTPEMLDRALVAYWQLDGLLPPGVESQLRDRMRIALEAALRSE